MTLTGTKYSKHLFVPGVSAGNYEMERCHCRVPAIS